MCCIVLQCVAARCSALQCASHRNTLSGSDLYLCCSMLQCVAVCCSVLQCVSVLCCSAAMQCVKVQFTPVLQVVVVVFCSVLLQCVVSAWYNVLQYVATCCSVLRCVAVSLCLMHTCRILARVWCCSVLHYDAVRCNTLQYVALRCSTLQYVAVRCSICFWCTTMCWVPVDETPNFGEHKHPRDVIDMLSQCALQCAVAVRCRVL